MSSSSAPVSPARLLPVLLLALGATLSSACGDSEPEEPATTKPAPAAQTTSTDGKTPAKTDGAVADASGSKDPPGATKQAPAAPEPTPLPADANPALTNPSLAQEQAPATYKAKLQTSEGDFVIEVHRDWAPGGADRFYNLVKVGYFDNARFFRNVPGFMVQWGMSPYPEANKVWSQATIKDDPVKQSNKALYVTFAKTGRPDSRSTQIFINHKDNSFLDDMGFAPFGQVVEGADVVKKLYGGYGDGPPKGRGPRQDIVARFGNAYLESEFPELSWIKSASVL